MFEKLLHWVLSRRVRVGDLEIAYPSGRLERYGDGSGTLQRVRIADAPTLRAIALRPQLAVGEAYMDGKLAIESGTLYGFIELGRRAFDATPQTQLEEIIDRAGMAVRWARRIGPERARRNAAHHYDLDSRHYRLFLDADMQYSCAYFERPDMTLDQAQLAKKRLIAAKMLVEPGARVLDIGCGWGGMALYLAQVCGAEVTGVTLASEQLKVATERAEALGVSDRARFELRDYRHVEGRFDAIVSVGMFEHVGLQHFPAFFRAIARLLDPQGVALLHAIGVSRRSSAIQPFFDKYIFPNGFLGSLAQETAAIEPTGMHVRDVEVLALHYADTLNAWRRRFLENRAAVLELYDERFLRMWEFYLAAAEAGFRGYGMMVFQVQMAHDPARIPITRDYIHERMEALAEREKAIPAYAALHDPAPRPRRRA